jgi:hypothetical protein
MVYESTLDGRSYRVMPQWDYPTSRPTTILIQDNVSAWCVLAQWDRAGNLYALDSNEVRAPQPG